MHIVFINYSNHKSEYWTDAQREAATHYIPGKVASAIVDIPFPDVDPSADEMHVHNLADEEVARILKHNPSAVLCQGEMTLCFAVTRRLIAHNIPALAACSRRYTTEIIRFDGTVLKQAHFAFTRFRKYE